jgi:glycosyltransferase involved in cell wall biosynthesis
VKHTDITVIVCTYNRKEVLRRALGTLTDQETGGEFSYEIVVIDDASSDGTSSVVAEASSRSRVPIRYLRVQAHGIAHARNTGIESTSGKWVAFFDDDQLATAAWLRELYAVAVNTGASCVGGSRLLRLPPADSPRLSTICRALLGEMNLGDRPDKCGRKLAPCTGNTLVRREVFRAVGSFDEATARGGEDIEFMARLRKAGFEAWYAPRAVVHHLIPPYRLKEEYFHWVSLRVGDNFAYRDYTEWGLAWTVMACAARLGQLALVNAPLLAWAYLVDDGAEVLGRRCLIWRALAYARRTINLLAPGLFPQEHFFARLEFRKERVAFE